jgi:hypothetical protein
MSCLEHFSMAQSNTEEHQRFSQSELDNVSRGSILKVSDPDKGVWYWVIIERRLDNHHFIGRIDADCLIRPSLRHGGRIAFHQDHILYIWSRKADQVFDSAWFRLLSHILSFGTVTKVLKRSTPGSNSVRLEMRFTRHIKWLPSPGYFNSFSTHRWDHRGFDLISDALPFGRLWYGEPDAVSNAFG